MEEQPSIFLSEISEADWEKTPESVKKLVAGLVERMARLEEEQQHLRFPGETELEEFIATALALRLPKGLRQSLKRRAASSVEDRWGVQGINRNSILQSNARRLRSITQATVVNVGMS